MSTSTTYGDHLMYVGATGNVADLWNPDTGTLGVVTYNSDSMRFEVEVSRDGERFGHAWDAPTMIDALEIVAGFHFGCPWLVERPSGNPEPDSYADTVRIDPCGARPRKASQFCEHHHQLATMDEREFEAMVDEREAGR